MHRVTSRARTACRRRLRARPIVRSLAHPLVHRFGQSRFGLEPPTLFGQSSLHVMKGIHADLFAGFGKVHLRIHLDAAPAPWSPASRSPSIVVGALHHHHLEEDGTGLDGEQQSKMAHGTKPPISWEIWMRFIKPSRCRD